MDRDQIYRVWIIKTRTVHLVFNTPWGVSYNHTDWIGGWSVERDKRWNWRREAEISNYKYSIYYSFSVQQLYVVDICFLSKCGFEQNT